MCSRAAHELKGVLNGVSVNLEVVRSRSDKVDALASSVNRYATAASGQLDAVIAMTEAILSLARAAHEPVDIAIIVRRTVALLAPVARAEGHQLEAVGEFDDLEVTSAPASAVRLVIGRCVLAAIDASDHVRCTPVLDASGPMVRVEGCTGSVLAIDAGVLEAAAGVDIRIQAESSAISISFPRRRGEATRDS
jgi:signal transduction histidine kinase